jgi:hypothetical protein
MMGYQRSLAPEVGMGVTYLGWSDRRPFTVIEIVSPKKIVIQADIVKRIDSNGASPHQEYEYYPDPEGVKRTLTQRRNGMWIEVGNSMRTGSAYRVGLREMYHDYTF